MKFDDLLDQCGGNGAYQICVLLLLSVTVLFSIEALAYNFVAGYMDHWCEVEGVAHLPYLKQVYIVAPPHPDEEGYLDSCSAYALNYSSYSTPELMTWNRSEHVTNTTVTVGCDSWVYSQTHYQQTIRSQWDLVCDSVWAVPTILLVQGGGMLLAGLLAGPSNDKLGRKFTIYSSLCVRIVASMVTTFSPNVVVFLIAFTIQGFCSAFNYIAQFITIMEITSINWRNAFGMAFFMAYSCGFMMLSGVAYFIRHNVKLQFALYSPGIIFVIYWWLIPESPRWLILRGRYKEAEKVLRQMAAVNNKTLPENLCLEDVENEEVKSSGYLAVIKSPLLRKRTFIVNLHWFTCSLLYYSLSLNISSLAGNMYANTFIIGLIEIPANLLCLFFLEWKLLGRRGTCGWGMLIAGLLNLIIIPLVLNDQDSAVTVMSMIGKVFVVIAFCGIYVYTSELFPTDCRGGVMAAATICSGVAYMLAAFMGPPMSSIWEGLPPLIFGVFGTVAGLLIFLLPETLGKPLVDTVSDAEALTKKNTKSEEEKEDSAPNGVFPSDLYVSCASQTDLVTKL